MDQKNLLTQALGLIQTQRRHRWWLRAVTGMAAAVVFVTTYLLILPAITMENSTFEVTTALSEAELGESIDSEICAAADDGREETFFVLTADGDNAGLDEGQFAFDQDGVTIIEDEDGQFIELHREYTESGQANYWFVLEQGQSTRFSLSWMNGVDRYRSEAIEEEIPIQPEKPSAEEEIPEESAPPEEPGSGVPEQGDSEEALPHPEELPPDTEAPSTEVTQKPETPSLEDSGPELPEETASVQDNEPAEDTSGLKDETGTDSLATDSNAAFAAAGISCIRYGGVSPMRTVGAAPLALSRHEAPMAARAAVTATASDADETEDVEEPTETPDSEPPEPADDGEDETVYETIFYTETVLDREGDPEQEGHLTISFGCGRSLEDAAAGGQAISLAWLAELPVELPEAPLTVTKEGSFDEQTGLLSYTVTISAEQDCGGPLNVTDRFEDGDTPARYEADRFDLVLLGADDLETEVTGYLPMIETREGNFQSFVLSGLPALAAGERYRLTYTAVPEPEDGPGGAFQVSNRISTGMEAASLAEDGEPPAPAEDVCTVAYTPAAGETELEEYVLGRGYGNERPGFLVTLVDANGNPVEQVNGKYQLYEGQDYFYHFSIYAPAGIPDAGRYYYTMLEGVSIVGEPSSSITANDGTQIGTLTASGDGSALYLDMVDNTKIRLRLRFDMAVEFERGENGQPINSEFEFIQDDQDEDPQIAKTGRFNSDGQLEWTITALVPGWNGNESDYVTWSFQDLSESDAIDGSYYLPDLSSAEISITINGVTQTLHTVDEADTLNERIAYHWGKPGTRYPQLYLVAKHDSAHVCTNNLENQLSDGWCTDWNIKESTIVEIKYIDSEVDFESLASAFEKWPDESIYIGNTAEIFRDKKRADEANVEFSIPPIIEKSPLQNGQFTITLNEAKIDLSKHETITIQDTMSGNLVYRRGSISAVATDADGVAQPLIYGTDYTLSVADNQHELEITLLHPGPYEYTITYGVIVTETGPYTNKAVVEVFGEKFENGSSGSAASATATEYVLSAHKTNAATSEPVAGATYGLYSCQGELLAEAVSDENGDIHFTGDPAAGFMLASDYLYYLQETVAPDGYLLSDTRYWFYYDDSDPDTIDALRNTAALEGLYHDGDPMEIVTNHGYTDRQFDDSETNFAVPIEVQDEKIGYELPATGGAGTTQFTTGGLALMALAGLMYKILRRKGEEAP